MELSEIAASVAKALGLKRGSIAYFAGGVVDGWLSGDDDGPILSKTGSNLFDPYWQVRCRDWLLERGHDVHFLASDDIGVLDDHRINLQCPAAEFCARAIHALETKG